MTIPAQRVVVRGQPIPATLALTGAAPQTATTLAFDPKNASEGTLSVYIKYKITTNTITYTLSWEISADGGTTWVPVAPANNAANVTLATGTGSGVTAEKVIDAPPSAYGHHLVRAKITTGAAAGGGAAVDEIQAFSYNWRKPFNAN